MTRCPDYDALLVGRPADSEEDLLLIHAETCDACADALLDDGWDESPLAAALHDLREETCPPEVLAAVHRATATPRRASDRPSSAPTRRRAPRWGVFASTLAAALLVGVLGIRALGTGAPEPAGPVIAEAQPVEMPSPRPSTEAEAQVETPSADPTLATPVPSAEALMEVSTAAQPAAPRRTTPDSTERRTVPAPPPSVATPLPADAPVEQFADAPLPDSVAAARDDLQLAFALVGQAQRRAGGAVTHEVDRLSDALRRSDIF